MATNWIGQDEACDALGIKRQTLYAYVSRGRIAAMPDPEHQGHSLYRGSDVVAMKATRARGRKRQVIAASTMSWGEPIISTKIATIEGNRLYYRGRDAILLAETATFEEIAALLWGMADVPILIGARSMPYTLPPRANAYVVMGLLAAEGVPAHGLSAAARCREAAQLVGHLASAFVDGLSQTGEPLHERLSAAWGGQGSQADLIRRALVLLADQELTTSAFAARVTASTGASLGAAAVAGLAAVSGPLHGDATIRVRALLEEARERGPMRTVRRWLESGLDIPGFGHPLYVDGDPRAAALLAAFEPPETVRTLVDCVVNVTGRQPTIDVALAALVQYAQLPEESAFMLFAIGRSVGWMAHAMEQIAQGDLLRPRARYIGPAIEVN